MSEKKTVRVQVVMAPSEVDQIDDWGFKHRIRSRSEVVRRLLLAGLAAMKKVEGSGKPQPRRRGDEPPPKSP
jgi:Arc/MetJ-type ribon-helix-helix transcriptional regulator